MRNFLSQNILTFPMYILFTKIIKTFWSKDVTNTWVLVHFVLKIHKDFWTYQVFICWIVEIFWDKTSRNQTRKFTKRTISSLYVLNCFKYFQVYILGQISQKIRQENYIKSLCTIFCAEMFQYFHIVHIKSITQ